MKRSAGLELKLNSIALLFATPGSGQVFEHLQWVADFEYEQGTTTATRLFVAKLTILRGQLDHLTARAGIELRTTSGAYRIILLPQVSTADITLAIVLS